MLPVSTSLPLYAESASARVMTAVEGPSEGESEESSSARCDRSANPICELLIFATLSLSFVMVSVNVAYGAESRGAVHLVSYLQLCTSYLLEAQDREY